MRRRKFRLKNLILLSLILFLGLGGCQDFDEHSQTVAPVESSQSFSAESIDSDQALGKNIEEEKPYYRMEDVAAYIYYYNKLPVNYLKKDEAKDLGWIPKENNLWEVTDKMVIGGDYFGNYEGLLPEDRSYKEADVNYDGGPRGPERLVYDEDGNIFYTKDHYETFERIY